MRILLCLSVLCCVPAPQAGAEPPTLPTPRNSEPAPNAGPTIVVVPYYRVSQYAIWDHYEVDRRGAFKPRIVATPFGAFRSIDGKPYPWVTTNSRFLMPYATD